MHADISILTLGRTRGVDATPLPVRFFFNFFKMIFCQHLPFSVAVGISLRHFDASLARIGSYGYEI